MGVSTRVGGGKQSMRVTTHVGIRGLMMMWLLTNGRALRSVSMAVSAAVSESVSVSLALSVCECVVWKPDSGDSRIF